MSIAQKFVRTYPNYFLPKNLGPKNIFWHENILDPKKWFWLKKKFLAEQFCLVQKDMI